ncbi:hypothetical protein TrispH2_008803 [Trichoplax sp. H2]|nr:hypothetical protein TrispH2_008803 [Trichoplax sp. H2]|eukprot:RDD39950.1 hypothetical protein TrispH2_008803 [Trichoplax sp. H2]
MNHSDITLSIFPFSSSITFIAITTNIFVVVLILSQRHLRTSCNALICSSCISASMAAMTEVLAGSVSNFVVNPIKTTLLQCVLSIPLRTTMFCIFTLHVTMLSLERFYSVIYPFKYRRFVNKKNATIVLFLTWAVPLFFVVLLIEFISYLQFGYCFPWSNMGIFALVLVYILPPLTFFLPPLVTFFVYLKILRQIDALERKIWSVSCQKEETCRWTSYRHMLRHRKVLFQMFTILAVYSVAFIPCIVVYLVYFTHYDTSLLLPILITYLMATSYLFIHPVLAIIFTAAIKSEFKKKFGRHYWLSAGRSFCRCHRYWVKNNAIRSKNTLETIG